MSFHLFFYMIIQMHYCIEVPSPSPNTVFSDSKYRGRYLNNTVPCRAVCGSACQSIAPTALLSSLARFARSPPRSLDLLAHPIAGSICLLIQSICASHGYIAPVGFICCSLLSLLQCNIALQIPLSMFPLIEIERGKV